MRFFLYYQPKVDNRKKVCYEVGMGENTTVNQTVISLPLHGRRKIFGTEDVITKDNVIDVVNNVLTYHLLNLAEEEYLYWYRRGLQPILKRRREVRPELTKHVVVNNANQVVTFKNGYFMTAPASYSARNEEDTELVKRFNDYCIAAGKQIVDNEIIDWFHTTGLGALYIEPGESERQPFKVYSLDPRSACCAYSYRPGEERVLGMNVVVQGEKVLFDVFTKERKFTLMGGMTGVTTTINGQPMPLIGTATDLIAESPNVLGIIPIIEYQYDINRMCAFETAMPICDEINEMQSRLAEGIEGNIQQLAVAWNCNFDEGTTANKIRERGMLVLRSTGDNKADFKLIESNLSQAETQKNIDALYEQLLDKTGLPSISRNEGGSSDNGSAVYLKSGYTIADTNRRNTEDFWRKSDMEFRKAALQILKLRFADYTLEPEDFNLEIEPPTMSNLLVKTQAALNMRQLGLAPQIWLERSGISNDPIADIELSKDYIYDFYNSQNGDEETPSEGEALNDDRQVEELSSMNLD